MPPAPRQVADVKGLRAAIKAREFAPAYYFYGAEDYVKEEELRHLVDAAIDSATRDFNLETLRGADLDAETLGTIVGTPPMMAERRGVVIRDVHALKKDPRAILDSYLDKPSPDVLLVLVAPAAGGARPDKRLQSATTAIEFAPLTGNRVPKWIAYYAQHNLGSTITEGAIDMLQKAVGTDLAQLRLELDKLAVFTSGEPITEDAVAAVVGVRPGETMGDLLDAVARRDSGAALTVLSPLLQQPKTGAVIIILALTAQTLVIGWAVAGRERTGRVPPRDEVFDLLKASGSVYTGRSWTDFVAACVNGANTWTLEHVDAALEALLEADFLIKSSHLSSEEQVLSNLVLALCGASPRRRAA